MADLHSDLTRRNGKWHILVRKGSKGAAEAAWVSLGGCTSQVTAVRVWLACLAAEKR